MKKNNIVVVGGGTAGWVTALFAEKYYKDHNVILVESSEIGILGAGEGSTPFLIDFFTLLGIDTMQIMKNTKGTFKNGIVFDNWNGDGKRYAHMFEPTGEMSKFALDGIFSSGCRSYFYNKLIAKGINFDDYVFNQKLTYLNKAPCSISNNVANPEIFFSIHFDARLLADYLRSVGVARGIKIYDDKLKRINTDDEGYISSIDFESGLNLETAFVYDCTGLKREIIGKFYNSKWKDYSEHLPCDSAIPFFPPMEDEIPPYTLSKAMKYGWMWKIPLQHRFGAGYVFDSKQVSEDNAKKELDDLMGYEVQSPRTFKFNPGSFKEVWIKNCMAVGLAAGFIEPLEATSIWAAAAQLDHSLRHFVLTKDRNSLDFFRKRFNQTIENSNDRVLDFIYLHYITKRKDTKFWRDFRKINKPTPGILAILNEIENGPLDIVAVEKMNEMKYHIMKWSDSSYLEICNGLGLLDKKFAKNYSENFNPIPSLDEYTIKANNIINKLLGHKEFLKVAGIYNP